MEIEHVNVEALFELEAQGIEVEPKASTIAVIQVSQGQTRVRHASVPSHTRVSVGSSTISDRSQNRVRHGRR